MKTQMICFRVEPAAKERIEEAARKAGQSITTFVQEAVMRAVEKSETAPAKMAKRRSGVPDYFRAFCQEAAQGGTIGYKRPAFELCRQLDTEIPEGMSKKEWQQELLRLSVSLWPSDSDRPTTSENLHQLRDDITVWGWFEQHFPDCAALIPARRRKQFVEGVYQATDEGVIVIILD